MSQPADAGAGEQHIHVLGMSALPVELQCKDCSPQELSTGMKPTDWQIPLRG